MGGSVSVGADLPVPAVTETGLKLLELVQSLDFKESAKTEIHERVLRSLLILLQTEEVLEAHRHYDETYQELHSSEEMAEPLRELQGLVQQYEQSPKQSPEGITLPALLEKAQEIQGSLGAIINEIKDEFASSQPNELIVAFVAPLKTAQSAEQKAARKYAGDVSRVLDFARASLVFTSLRPAMRAIASIRSLCEAQPYAVARVKTHLLTGSNGSSLPSGGYRDIKVNIAVSGHICEIQIHIDDFYHHKRDKGYGSYKWARDREIKTDTKLLELISSDDRSSEVLEQMVGFLEACNLPERDGVLDFLYEELGMFPQLLALREAGRQSNERVFGDDHANTLKSMTRLALVHLKMDDREALNLLRTVRERCLAALGARDPSTISSTITLAEALVSFKEQQEALPLLEQGVMDCSEVLGADHSDTVRAKIALAMCLEVSGRLDAAEQNYRDILAHHKRISGDHSFQAAESTLSLANVLLRQQRFEEAANQYRAVLSAQRATGNNTMVAKTALRLVEALEPLGLMDEAVLMYKETLELVKREPGQKHPLYMIVLESYAAFLQRRDNLEEAEQALREAVAMRKEVFGERNDVYLMDLQDLGRLLSRQGKEDEATSILKEALKGGEEVGTPSDAATLSVKEDLSSLSANAL